MIIVHDRRLPEEAIATLKQYGECLPFFTENITCEAIAGHPDIFFFPSEKHIIVAPNTPEYVVDFLQKKRFTLQKGVTCVGKEKENSSCYNVVLSDSYIIHNRKYTDVSILESVNNRMFIHVNQAYTRCSLLSLKGDNFITSDRGIEKVLLKQGLNCCYVSPKEILLPGYANGCIGGCMGVVGNRVFVCGDLDFYPERKRLQSFLHQLGYEVIPLYNGKLFDGGSLFFLP
ncbi:MAG: hypothetical protein LBH82_02125 [Bacteroidales bacterium]|jgi:hypothetical protein|nr:hypothetical protein [Bacteroidales bacterium]